MGIAASIASARLKSLLATVGNGSDFAPRFLIVHAYHVVCQPQSRIGGIIDAPCRICRRVLITRDCNAREWNASGAWSGSFGCNAPSAGLRLHSLASLQPHRG